MEMHPVKSSAVTHIGFENGVLRVRYSSGQTYEYENVSKHTHEALMASDSKGKFLGKNFGKGSRGVQVK